MPAPRKYPDELRERAVRLVFDIKEEAGSISAACTRIGEQLGINPDTLRGWVKQVEIDTGQRPGVTSADAARIRQLDLMPCPRMGRCRRTSRGDGSDVRARMLASRG